MPLDYTLTIRDPFHGNMPFTALEHRIIDLPIFQRLRGLKQSSLAHYTYPTALTTRFEHSLGATHIAGSILHHIANTQQIAFRKLIRRVSAQYSEFPPGSKRSFGDCLTQGVRLACLLHDIGHLPFSHCFEEDLRLLLLQRQVAYRWGAAETRDYVRFLRRHRADGLSEPKLHEFLSQKIASTYPAIKAAPANACERLAYEIALDILDSTRSSASRSHHVRDVLGSIVHGEIDADRLDFVRRDSGMAGSGLGNFSVDRVITSFVLFDDGHQLHLYPSIRALSALETFFLARLSIYRWQYHHHDVIYHDLVLRLLVRGMLLGKYRGLRDLDLLGAISYDALVRGPNLRREAIAFWPQCDDSLILAAIEDVRQQIRRRRRPRAKPLSIADERALIMIEEVLFRRKRRVALWKDHIGFTGFAREVHHALVREVQRRARIKQSQAQHEVKLWCAKLRLGAEQQDEGIAQALITRMQSNEGHFERFQDWLWTSGEGFLLVDFRKVTPFRRLKESNLSEVKLCGRSGDNPPVHRMTEVSDTMRGVAREHSQEIRLFAYSLLRFSRRPSLYKDKPAYVARRRSDLARALAQWCIEEPGILDDEDRKALSLTP